MQQHIDFPMEISVLKYQTWPRISSDKADYFPKEDVRFYFVEIMTGDTRHTQQINIDKSMYPCPLVRIFKMGFPKCMLLIYFFLNVNLV